MRDSPALIAAAAPVFCVLAVANSAGYRYGASDLSFYLPAAFKHLDAALFPRDAALLQTQARLGVSDELLASALRATHAIGVSDASLVYALHLVSLVILFSAAILLGRALFRSPWSIAALAAALTLRHAVARTGVNTLEGYFHPRVLAFAICAVGIAAFVRRGAWLAFSLVILAGLAHPTTAFWFAIMFGVAGLASGQDRRAPLVALAAVAAIGAGWALLAGPLAGRLAPMDADWLAVIADRAYLFADRWPAHVWMTHAFTVGVIALAACVRRRTGRLAPREAALLAGAAALVVLFLALLPLVAWRVVLAIQLQPARIFWVLDLVAVISIFWLIEALADRGWHAAPMVIASVLTVASMTRGAYLMTVQFPERSIARPSGDATPWDQAMHWAETNTPRDAHWLAHPDHAFRYGTSLRVAARRDVFHEQSKDPAVAMYDRGVAMRVRERSAALGEFDAMTAAAFADLAQRYDLDWLVTERELDLPLAYQNSQFKVYRLQEFR
jgi:hypothetical protein